MASNINPNNLDITYPIAGQDNDTQGFRTNFTNIRDNFNTAANEITAIQNTLAVTPTITNVPISISSAGTAGQIAFNSTTFWVCIAPHTWVPIPTVGAAYTNSNVAAYLPSDPTIAAINANVNSIVTGTGFATTAQLWSNVGNINANTTSLRANITAANAVISTNTTNINLLNANVTAANAVIAVHTGNIATLFSNAATQQTQINTLQTQVYANANVTAYLPTYSGSVANLTVAGNLTVNGTMTTINTTIESVTGTEVVAGVLTANSGTASSSTTTGALIVNGGAGVSGSIYAASFNGPGTNLTGTATSLNIGGSAPAASLVGTTLASGITTSSLTQVGTLTNLTVTNPINGNIAGAAGSVPAANLTGSTLSANVTASSLTSTGQLVNTVITSLGVGTAASGTLGEIRATNNITAYYSSDKKFKENVRPIPNAVDTVLAIGGKLFDWTDEYVEAKGGVDGYFVQKSDFGVIAQDVKAVLPEAVRTREDGTLAVDYAKLSALAFAAIAELKAEIDRLKGQ